MKNKQQAEEFLRNIRKEDKIGLIFHDDLDGFASGIQMMDYCKKVGCRDIKIYIFSFGFVNREEVFREMGDRNKIIAMDVAPYGIAKELEKVIEGKQVLSIDHHQREFELQKNIIDCYSEGYEPASKIVSELLTKINGEENKPWLALAGTIADAGDKYKENEEFVFEKLSEMKTTIGDFRKEYTDKIEKLMIYFNENLYRAFEILSKMKNIEEIKKYHEFVDEVDKEFKKYEDLYKNKKEMLGDVNFFFLNPQFSIKTLLINRISLLHPHDIIIFAVPSDNGKILISARNQVRRMSMIDLMKKAIVGLNCAVGGGHAAAAGGEINAVDLEKFKKNLREMKF